MKVIRSCGVPGNGAKREKEQSSAVGVHVYGLLYCVLWEGLILIGVDDSLHL